MGSEAMSPHVMKKLAKPMLFAAAIIWGTSFFVMKNALDVIPVFYLLAIRFTAGAVLLAAVCWKKWAGFTWDYLWRGAVIGAFLFLAYSVQTFGLDRTTPSKNAFLTAVYCVIVPFLYWAAARRRPDRYNILAALLCVTGVGLVSLDGDLSVNAGDVLRTSTCSPYSSLPLRRCMPGQGERCSRTSPLRRSWPRRSACLWPTCALWPPLWPCSSKTWGRCGRTRPPRR